MFHICPVSLGNCLVNSELSGHCGRTTEISYHKLWTHVNSPASSAVTLQVWVYLMHNKPTGSQILQIICRRTLYKIFIKLIIPSIQCKMPALAMSHMILVIMHHSWRLIDKCMRRVFGLATLFATEATLFATEATCVLI